MDDVRSCVVCLTPCLRSNGNINVVPTEKEPDKISNGLNVYFVLKNVLELPNAHLEELLKKHGNPSEWGISVCESCKETYLDRAKSLLKQETTIKAQFQTLRTQVKEHLHRSHVNQEKIEMALAQAVGGASALPPTKGKGKGKGRKKAQGTNQVFTEVRKWVVDHVDPEAKQDVSVLIEAAGGIDNYVAQKKAAATFNKLGPGRKLTDNQPGPSSAVVVPNKTYIVEINKDEKSSTDANSTNANATAINIASQEKRAAAAAALARFEKAKKPEADSKEFLAARQAAFIKEQVKKQIEEENSEKDLENGLVEKNNNRNENLVVPKRVIDPASYAVKGVYFGSSLIGGQLLSKREIEDKIKEYLSKQLRQEENEDLLTSETAALIIHSCNKPQERVTACVETLCKLLDNIIHNPTEPKYRQIRCSNIVFQNKVASLYGAEQFLKAAGFYKQMMPNMDTWSEVEEEYWHLDPEEGSSYIADLIEIRDVLKQTTPIKPELDRNVQVLRPEQVAKRTELPDEFFVQSAEEIKKEQKLKTDIVERELILRTKAMRERDAMGEQRLYRYGVMRVRFPDSTILQGTFGAYEKISNLFDFVRHSLTQSDLKFDLVQPGGQTITAANGSSTLTDFKLPPSSTLIFHMENTPEALVSGELSYLRSSLYRQIQN